MTRVDLIKYYDFRCVKQNLNWTCIWSAVVDLKTDFGRIR